MGMPEAVWKRLKVIYIYIKVRWVQREGRGGEGFRCTVKKKDLIKANSWFKVCAKGFTAPVDHNERSHSFVSRELELYPGVCVCVCSLGCKEPSFGWWRKSRDDTPAGLLQGPVDGAQGENNFLTWLQCKRVNKSRPDWAVTVFCAICLVDRLISALKKNNNFISFCANTASTALGSWSCATRTSSWGRERPTSGARTRGCGWFSGSTSTRPRAEPCPCRLPPTRSSAVSNFSNIYVFRSSLTLSSLPLL